MAALCKRKCSCCLGVHGVLILFYEYGKKVFVAMGMEYTVIRVYFLNDIENDFIMEYMEKQIS